MGLENIFDRINQSKKKFIYNYFLFLIKIVKFGKKPPEKKKSVVF